MSKGVSYACDRRKTVVVPPALLFVALFGTNFASQNLEVTNGRRNN